MSEGILIDNDIIIKISAYSLGAEMLHSTTIFGIPPAILGVGRFVVRSRLKKNKNIVNNGEAEKSFSTISQIMTVVEPDEKEIDLAARLEDAASSLNLELDSGESQLLAVLIIRNYRLLLTGDKRAIRAVANIPSHAIKKNVACFEQLISDILKYYDLSDIRRKVSREPHVDRAITLCFGCSSAETPSYKDVIIGLSSYCDHLRSEAAAILISGHDLSTLTS